MKITIIGRGNVGGALERALSANGHEVEALGSGGGDAAGADAVILAVPGDAVEDALRNESLSALAKSVVNGPTAKAFNTNFAGLFEQAASLEQRPTMPICGDDEAVRVAEQLSRECGYEPLVWGGLEHAAALEDYVSGLLVPLVMTRGPFFYRFDWP